jgi:phage terminase large subunit
MSRASATSIDLALALEGRPEWTRPLYEGVLAEPSCRPRWIGASGGRASGKSFAFAEASILGMLRWGARVVCARETLNSLADSSKQLVEDRIRGLDLEKHFVITEREVRCRLRPLPPKD